MSLLHVRLAIVGFYGELRRTVRGEGSQAASPNDARRNRSPPCMAWDAPNSPPRHLIGPGAGP
jgi:hypothetical protein